MILALASRIGGIRPASADEVPSVIRDPPKVYCYRSPICRDALSLEPETNASLIAKAGKGVRATRS